MLSRQRVSIVHMSSAVRAGSSCSSETPLLLTRLLYKESYVYVCVCIYIYMYIHNVYTTCRRARPRRISVSEMAWSPLVLRKTNASTTDGNTIDSFLCKYPT